MAIKKSTEWPIDQSVEAPAKLLEQKPNKNHLWTHPGMPDPTTYSGIVYDLDDKPVFVSFTAGMIYYKNADGTLYNGFIKQQVGIVRCYEGMICEFEACDV